MAVNNAQPAATPGALCVHFAYLSEPCELCADTAGPLTPDARIPIDPADAPAPSFLDALAQDDDEIAADLARVIGAPDGTIGVAVAEFEKIAEHDATAAELIINRVLRTAAKSTVALGYAKDAEKRELDAVRASYADRKGRLEVAIERARAIAADFAKYLGPAFGTKKSLALRFGTVGFTDRKAPTLTITAPDKVVGWAFSNRHAAGGACVKTTVELTLAEWLNLGALLVYAAEQNPELKAAAAEIDGKLAKIVSDDWKPIAAAVKAHFAATGEEIPGTEVTPPGREWYARPDASAVA